MQKISPKVEEQPVEEYKDMSTLEKVLYTPETEEERKSLPFLKKITSLSREKIKEA
jgi:hypothetical protein